jgi:hypothetical protein
MIDDTEYTDLREVAPGLFVGGMFAPRYAPGRFKTIINLYGHGWPKSREPPANIQDMLLAQERALRGVSHHLIFRMEDDHPFPSWLYDIVERTIRANNGDGVLIHCFAGISRSMSMAYAMLRTVYNKDDNDAYAAASHPLYMPCTEPLLSAIDWARARNRQ